MDGFKPFGTRLSQTADGYNLDIKHNRGDRIKAMDNISDVAEDFIAVVKAFYTFLPMLRPLIWTVFLIWTV